MNEISPRVRRPRRDADHRMKASWAAVLLCFAAGGSASAANLLDVYTRALDTDPLWQQAGYTRMAIREDRTQALLNLLPVDVTANKNFTRYGGSDIRTPAFAAASLSINLFSWDSWVALKSADATVGQSEANYQAAAQGLMQRVSQQYFAVLAAQDTLAATQSALQSVQSQLDQSEQGFEAGLIASSDIKLARASRDSTNAAVIAAKRSLATQEDLLRSITNESYMGLAGPRDDMPLLFPDPASEDQWVRTAMGQNASLIASRLAGEIAHDNLLTAYGGHLPTINVSVSRNWALEHGNYPNDASILGQAALIGTLNAPATALYTTDLYWSVGISIPLFSAGATQSRVRQARFTWDAAKSGTEFVSRQTEERTRDAYQGLISQIAQVGALKEAVGSDRVALQATLAGYQVGTKTVVDVLTSRAQLLQDDTNFALAKYAYLNAIVSLRLAAGNLNRATIEEINGWLVEPRPPPPSIPAPEPITKPRP